MRIFVFSFLMIMEITDKKNDKNLASHDLDRLYIRTMKEDLAKIKDGSFKRETMAFDNSSLDSFSSPNPQVRNSRPDLNRSASAMAPKNLPINFIDEQKEYLNEEAKTKMPRSAFPDNKSEHDIHSGFSSNQGLGSFNSFGREFAEKKNIPVSKPSEPLSSREFLEKLPHKGYVAVDADNLSPEARLAKQNYLGDGEYNEALVMPSAVKMPVSSINSSNTGRQNGKPEALFNSAVSKPYPSEYKKRSIEEVIKDDNSDSLFKKFIKLFFFLLIVSGIIGAVYYFYLINKTAENSVISRVFISDAEEAVISTDLNSDLTGEIRSYFSGAKPSGIYRLILKNKDGNKYLGLEAFNKSLNIILPDSFDNYLEKDYNLIVFNYPEKNYLRLGLVLKPKKSSDISVFAKNWEQDMFRNTEAMFTDNARTDDSGKQFKSNKRDNFDIRYLFLGSENTALNYAIDAEKNYFLIATSKEDIFNLIDNTK